MISYVSLIRASFYSLDVKLTFMILYIQLSIDAQKIEERTMRQCILRPLTPSSNKISVSTQFIAFVPMHA
jgi:hypothetical protein